MKTATKYTQRAVIKLLGFQPVQFSSSGFCNLYSPILKYPHKKDN